MRIHSVTTCKVFIRGSYCIFRVFFRDQSKSHTYYRSIIWGVCQAASLLLWLRRVKIPILAKGRCCYLNNREIIYNMYGEGGVVCTQIHSLPACRSLPRLILRTYPYLSVPIRTTPPAPSGAWQCDSPTQGGRGTSGPPPAEPVTK